MRYYLGIDNGGTNTKAALFTARGEQVAVESVSTAAVSPAPGFVERDMEEMWADNCAVLRRLLDRSGVDPHDIAGIGLCGHGKGLYLWGKDGRPVRRGILSSDNRAWRYPARWRADGTEQAAFRLSRQHMMACQPPALLRWLEDNEPGTLDKTRWIFECKDYVRFRLTGSALAERTDQSGTGLMDLNTAEYDRELLALYGLDILDMLPPLCGSMEISGAVTEAAAALTGLCAGTPVVSGMFDIDACALAANITDEKDICMIAGTWSINEYIRRTPVTDGTVQMNSLYCLPGWYLIEESSPTSAGNNEWFIRKLLPELAEGGGSIYEQVNRWVSEFSPADFVPVFLPFLTASNVDPRARSAFLGLNASHDRRHMARAVYEGVTFSHRWHFDKLMASRGSREGAIRLAGGAARSAVWTQMFADVMNMPVEAISAAETGALGCAIAAAAALGEYATPAEAAAGMSPAAEPVLPRPEAATAYEKKYGLYRKAIEALNGFWPAMQDYIDQT